MKKRTMNELRQTKEYGYRAPVGITHEVKDTPEEINLSTSDIAAIYNSGTPPYKPTLNEQIQEIASKVLITVSDQIFHAIIEEMSNYDELNWGWFVQDDAPTALLDACFDHKNEIHYEIFQLVLQKLK